MRWREEKSTLTQQTRNEMYKLIKENEGIHFRDIGRKMNKEMGVVQYHLHILEKEGYIRSLVNGRYKCFFITSKNQPILYTPLQELTNPQKRTREILLMFMRQKTSKMIIEYLKTNNQGSHQKLSQITNVSPQAITFLCQRLVKSGVVESYTKERQKYYSLTSETSTVMSYI